MRRAYPVAPPAVVTATVITEVPNGAGHGGREGAAGVGRGPSTTVVAPPPSVAVEATSTVAPGRRGPRDVDRRGGHRGAVGRRRDAGPAPRPAAVGW